VTQSGFAPTQAGLYITNDMLALNADFDYFRRT
jgi:hypothetical protein